MALPPRVPFGPRPTFHERELRRLRFMARLRDENRQYTGGSADGNHLFLRPNVLSLTLDRLLGRS